MSKPWSANPLLLSALILAAAVATALPEPVRAASPGVPAACAEHPCIQVGSYNIEYLGDQQRGAYKGEARPPRTPEEVAALAARVADELDLEVVVFEEVDTASERWGWMKAALAERGYEVFAGATSERSQFVVLAWDRDEVELLDAGRELDLPDAFADPDDRQCHYAGLRKPIAARLRAGAFDFWTVGVHLKSRAAYDIPETCPAWIRTQQTRLLAAAIDQLAAASGEQDVLIAGDFNETFDHPSLAPLKDAGFTSQMAERLDGSASLSYINDEKYPAELIDHVMLRATETRERVPASGFILPVLASDKDTYIRRGSDHAPVWTSLRTDQDLD